MKFALIYGYGNVSYNDCSTNIKDDLISIKDHLKESNQFGNTSSSIVVSIKEKDENEKIKRRIVDIFADYFAASNLLDEVEKNKEVEVDVYMYSVPTTDYIPVYTKPFGSTAFIRPAQCKSTMAFPTVDSELNRAIYDIETFVDLH